MTGHIDIDSVYDATMLLIDDLETERNELQDAVNDLLAYIAQNDTAPGWVYLTSDHPLVLRLTELLR